MPSGTSKDLMEPCSKTGMELMFEFKDVKDMVEVIIDLNSILS
jgi:hypothetical protein